MIIFLFFSLLLNSIFSKIQLSTEWTANLLFDYTNKTINDSEAKLEYIILDPDGVLNESAKNIIYDKMENFYINKTNKTVINFIVLFKTMNETESDLETLIDSFSSKMDNFYTNYIENKTLLWVFSINSKKSQIKMGSTLTSFLSNFNVLKILENIQTEINNQNYDKAIEDLIDNINNYYGIGISTFLFWSIFISMMACPFCIIICVTISVKCNKNSKSDLNNSNDYGVGDYKESGGEEVDDFIDK